MKNIIILLACFFVLPVTYAQNNPPVADPGGPYYGTRTDAAIPVTLGAHDSYDPDEPLDEIVKYKWDTDGDGLYGADDTGGSALYSPDSDAEGVEIEVVTEWYPGQNYPISLIVEDSNGASSSPASTNINIVAYNSTSFPVNIHTLVIDDDVSGNALFKIRISHPYADAQVFDAEFHMMPAGVPLACFDSGGNPVTQLSYAGGNVITEYEIWFNSTDFADGAECYRLRTTLTKSGELYETVKTTQGTFTIDNTAPEITCPTNRDRAADHTDTYTTDGNEFDPVSVTDNFSLPTISNDINSLQSLAGYVFNTGSTTITWSAEDDAGNTSTCNFDLNVSVYSGIDDNLTTDILAYPNPVSDNLRIILKQVPVPGTFRIISADGRVLHDQAIKKGILDIDFSDYSRGMYTILLMSRNEIVSSIRIIKE